ncbi:MFS transporter [Paenibacillus glufosinatiresistens]|uniref:MFS transporter n=1 Tax=Paenibacillus glufosinatiresistens TaxID=3070657 RepID=UPI00286DD62D|nr:MFS transporter [Paenibacillus sp. YX.27]
MNTLTDSPQDGQGGLRRNRPFLTLMAAQLVSNVGEWLYVLALLAMVGMKWQATPWEITVMSLCMAVPSLLGGPIAGVLADRMNRKRLMIGSDLVRAGLVALFLFAGTLWQVYALLIAKGLMDVLFSPAKSGKLKELVPSGQMEQAVSVSASIEQITKIAGPALGGVLVGMFGISVCYGIDAAAFLMSALLLLRLPAEFRRSREAAGAQGLASFRKDLSAGIAFISGMPMLMGGLLLLVTALLVLQVADSQAVTLLRTIPDMNEGVLGWCIGASGIGTLLYVLAAGKLGAGRPLLLMSAGAVTMGAVFAAAGVITGSGLNGYGLYAVLFSAFLVAGAGAGMIFIPFQTLLQQRTPETYSGRVFGTVGSLTSAAVILGPVAGGALVTAAGPLSAYLLSGSLLVLLGCGMLLLRTAIERRDIRSSEAAAALPETAVL